MLVELSIDPLGQGTHLSRDLGFCKSFDDSGNRYGLTSFGTRIEGEWDEVMPLIRRCHDKARSMSPHVFTMLRIEDEEGAVNKIEENVAAVERAAARSLKHC
jgi:uncharacterized protein YqgV (UPF0045/DUF77 family)